MFLKDLKRMEIQEPEQELTHMETGQMGNLRDDLAIEEDEDEEFGSISVESSSAEDSRDSWSCSSTFSPFDVEEDASSSSSSLPSPSSSSMALSSNGPLHDLSKLMSQLPIKRGLSKHYEGKSQSFTSLANVESTEDLAKKGWRNRHGMRMKSCKSFGGLCQQSHNRAYSPKATISKKAIKTASANMSSLGRRAALLEACGFSVPATVQETILPSESPSLEPLPSPLCKRT